MKQSKKKVGLVFFRLTNNSLEARERQMMVRRAVNESLKQGHNRETSTSSITSQKHHKLQDKRMGMDRKSGEWLQTFYKNTKVQE